MKPVWVSQERGSLQWTMTMTYLTVDKITTYEVNYVFNNNT